MLDQLNSILQTIPYKSENLI